MSDVISEQVSDLVSEKEELKRAEVDNQSLRYETKEGEADSQNYVVHDDFGSTRFVNGEPVITTGADVSNYAVDARDDEDPALTFRSLLIGTVVAGLGAALSQVSP